MNVFPFLYNQFYAVFKECDKICHLGSNGCLDFIALLQLFCVLKEKSCRRDSFSKYVNFLLNYENYDMKIFKLFSLI